MKLVNTQKHKTHLTFFSNGQGPKELPKFKLDDLIINFKEDV